jgi:glycosyltransferase involved in cell wall biosynthesis
MTTDDEHGARRPAIVFLGADAAYLHAFRGPLMRAFAARGYRVVAAAPGETPLWGPAFGALGADFVDWPIRKASLNPVEEVRAVLALWRILRRERPDLLFAHTIKPVIFGSIVGRLAGVRRRTAMIPGLGYAFTPGGGWRRRATGALARAAYRLALGQAQMVIFQNADDRAHLLQAGVLRPSAETGVVAGSGLDVERFSPQPWPEGPPTFLMVARLLVDKGVREFVAAAGIVRRQAPEARFILIGERDLNPSAISEAELSAWQDEGVVEMRGQVADPRQDYAACQVFVLPSYREGLPRVNLEAMATGRAVISTDVPGCRETVVDGETGLLVPVRDAEALAEAMLSLARDPERARAMGAAGRRLCEARFELGAVTRATADLIEGV